ncbi:GNAT family N-acetyltransferase [Sphingorhabdus sp. Alg231-15]|uniref:GNAT family N-acetyltransferase n=1 Tax=Sphingorhabdus sp. Alg231-15 TaxID=1922222 RepID=UPI000D559D61
MTLILRSLGSTELSAASELCLRSKAYWGYDEAFMASCREELTLTEADLTDDKVIAAEDRSGLAGIAQVSNGPTGCYLEKLFIDTDRIGQGIGKQLYDWSLATARDLGAKILIVEADPDAAPFYERMGCKRDGQAESGSVPDRILPRYVHIL